MPTAKIRPKAAKKTLSASQRLDFRSIVMTEPMVLTRQRRQQQAFLDRHPYLDPATLREISNTARNCSAFRHGHASAPAAAYAHVQRCSRCAKELERQKDQESVAI